MPETAQEWVENHPFTIEKEGGLLRHGYCVKAWGMPVKGGISHQHAVETKDFLERVWGLRPGAIKEVRGAEPASPAERPSRPPSPDTEAGEAVRMAAAAVRAALDEDFGHPSRER